MTSRHTAGPVWMHSSDVKVFTWDFKIDLLDAGDVIASITSIDDTVPGDAEAVTVTADLITSNSYLGWPRDMIPANTAVEVTLSGGVDSENRTVEIVLVTTGSRTLTYYLDVRVDDTLFAGPIYKHPDETRYYSWEFIKELRECADTLAGVTSIVDEETGDAGELSILSPQLIVADTEVGTPTRIVPANLGIKFGLSGGDVAESRYLQAVLTTNRGSTLYRRLKVDVRTS